MYFHSIHPSIIYTCPCVCVCVHLQGHWSLLRLYEFLDGSASFVGKWMDKIRRHRFLGQNNKNFLFNSIHIVDRTICNQFYCFVLSFLFFGKPFFMVTSLVGLMPMPMPMVAYWPATFKQPNLKLNLRQLYVKGWGMGEWWMVNYMFFFLCSLNAKTWMYTNLIAKVKLRVRVKGMLGRNVAINVRR